MSAGVCWYSKTDKQVRNMIPTISRLMRDLARFTPSLAGIIKGTEVLRLTLIPSLGSPRRKQAYVSGGGYV